MTNLKEISAEIKKDYRSGWNASERGGSLERADARGASQAWYDGYFDEAAGRDKYHTLLTND